MEPTGLELVLDLYGCQTDLLSDSAAIGQLVRESVRLAGFDIVGELAHEFPNRGLTLALILAQSHATVHTWPENGFCALDVYTCGGPGISAALDLLREHLVKELRPRSFQARILERGLDTCSE